MMRCLLAGGLFLGFVQLISADTCPATGVPGLPGVCVRVRVRAHVRVCVRNPFVSPCFSGSPGRLPRQVFLAFLAETVVMERKERKDNLVGEKQDVEKENFSLLFSHV